MHKTPCYVFVLRSCGAWSNLKTVKIKRMDYQQYNQEKKNLPDFMKDFHDQKDLFKCIQDWAARRETFKDLPNSWSDNHVFVIDYFLWFMSIHGYKLQKIKSDIAFCDINKTVSDFTEKRVKSLSLILQGKKDESQDG